MEVQSTEFWVGVASGLVVKVWVVCKGGGGLACWPAEGGERASRVFSCLPFSNGCHMSPSVSWVATTEFLMPFL